MKKPFFSALPKVSQLILLILITLVSFFVFALIGMLLASRLFHVPIAEQLQIIGMAGTKEVAIGKLLQIFQSIGIFIVPPLVIGWMASRKPFLFLGFKNRVSGTGFVLMLLVLLAAEPVVAFSGWLNQQMSLPDFLSGLENWMSAMEERAMELTESFLHVTTWTGLLVNLLMIAVIPGVGEELFFRGLLQQFFGKWFRNVPVAVIFTALLFSGLHMQFYGFLPRFLLGLLFGYLFVWSGNLWYPILAHILHNTLPVIGYYLQATGKTGLDLDEVGTGNSAWIWAIAGSVILVIFTRRFIAHFKQE